MTTLFVGAHYEKSGAQIAKYYFAGASRIAVRTNGTLSYLLGDHLGSSSVTTNASGVKTASALYKAFGETRFSSGALGTDYKFTGQREQAELGLYFYGARWFDPSIGRFTSPDTMIPSTQGTQAWDRYAYVNNNPVRYTDPTGHFICIFSCLIMPLFAWGPDMRGVNYVNGNVHTVNAVVAAGMAVQSNYYGPWDNSSTIADSVGPAQLMPEEVAMLDGDPLDPNDAALGMGERIATVVNACPGKCSDTDRLILAALGQNYPGFNAQNASQDLPKNPDGTIDWGKYISEEGGGSSDSLAVFRQSVTGLHYSTGLMLKLYTGLSLKF